MDSLKEVFQDWTIINTPARLRGAILHGARILRRDGNFDLAYTWERKVKQLPKVLNKEQINVILFSICVDLKLIN